MVRTRTPWHPKFIEYMNFIVNHPNYRGMPYTRKTNGGISWVAARSSKIGQARLKWWDNKREELGIPPDGPWISKVARSIHPTGEKPCQICGQVLKLDYIYPNRRGGLSPGAMSNAPDRLDGYHTYNRCHRAEYDKGRHSDNLARYGEDRRAYENWAGGDWKAASWLMKEFQKHGVSADHLGPISLGFAHRPKFRPLTRQANSARNNRMTYEDVKLLIEDEKTEPVISDHSRALWDLLKYKVANDSGALMLTKIMRENMHYILSIFSLIAATGNTKFLVKHFLHPEYANFSVKFDGFDPLTGYYKEMVKIEGNKRQYKNNAERYIRISFESLLKYQTKVNRNVKIRKSDVVDKKVKEIMNLLDAGDEATAIKELNALLLLIALSLEKKFTQSA